MDGPDQPVSSFDKNLGRICKTLGHLENAVSALPYGKAGKGQKPREKLPGRIRQSSRRQRQSRACVAIATVAMSTRTGQADT